MSNNEQPTVGGAQLTHSGGNVREKCGGEFSKGEYVRGGLTSLTSLELA